MIRIPFISCFVFVGIAACSSHDPVDAQAKSAVDLLRTCFHRNSRPMTEYVIGTRDEFPPGKAVAVEAGRRIIAVFRVGDAFASGWGGFCIICCLRK